MAKIEYKVELVTPAVTAKSGTIGKELDVTVKRNIDGQSYYSAKHIKGILKSKVMEFKNALDEKYDVNYSRYLAGAVWEMRYVSDVDRELDEIERVESGEIECFETGTEIFFTSVYKDRVEFESDFYDWPDWSCTLDEYKRVFNAEKIREKVYESLEYLKDDDDSALSLITNSIRNIEYLGKYDERYTELAKRMENAYYELEDCANEIEDISKGIDVSESDLDKIAGRMNTLKRIKEKYKRTLPELITYREDLKEKLSDIDSGDFKTKELKKELNKIKTEYDKIAEKLTISRKEIAIKIENELLNELKFLNMEDAKLKVQINKLERMTSEGYDDVEFFISTNVGQDLKPLNKIASGGEVSRVMLALKVIFSKVDNIPILIFDEIDTGIGGETVRKIALKLKEIGENTQIISITHSPVIASKASQQFYIEKYVENSKTISRVKKLSAEERIKEIGRMLVGEKINNEVLEIANKMLNEG